MRLTSVRRLSRPSQWTLASRRPAGPLLYQCQCRAFTLTAPRRCEKAGSFQQEVKQVEEQVQRGRKSGLAAFKKNGSKSDNVRGPKPKMILGQPANVPIRTRFAPSPTGHMHLGSLRTALLNKFVAAATDGGEFVVRIEDTDQRRLVPDAEARIFQDLEWADISWDEGPDKGGPYGPYRQSERLPIYKEHIQTLLANKSAYRCFCSSEQLEAQKRTLHDAGKSTAYTGTCRHLSSEESERRAAAGEPHVVRLDSGKFGNPKFTDATYGPFQKKDGEEDFVLVKTDGYPTYHFANVVDDHLMKITHVIRGEEWLISTPKHLALYQAFGWEAPTFAHLGLLVADDGSKLSKRNDSVNLSTYRQQNIFPVAMQAWLANLGSSTKHIKGGPKTPEEILENLSFRFTRGGIKLNSEKLENFQHLYRIYLTKKANTTTGLTPKESAVFANSFLQPLLDQIQSLNHPESTAVLLPRGTTTPWPRPLELVPQLQAEQQKDIQHAYLTQVLYGDEQKSSDHASRVQNSPYLYFRVPTAIYLSSLASSTVPREFFSVVHELLHDDSNPHSTVVQRAQSNDRLTKFGLDIPLTVYRVLRLISTGCFDSTSQSAGTMFHQLGSEEWKYRSSVVKQLLERGA